MNVLLDRVRRADGLLCSRRRWTLRRFLYPRLNSPSLVRTISQARKRRTTTIASKQSRHEEQCTMMHISFLNCTPISPEHFLDYLSRFYRTIIFSYIIVCHAPNLQSFVHFTTEFPRLGTRFRQVFTQQCSNLLSWQYFLRWGLLLETKVKKFQFWRQFLSRNTRKFVKYVFSIFGCANSEKWRQIEMTIKHFVTWKKNNDFCILQL